MVFAYYFLATSTYGNLQANYAQDITDAQALGIDGFAVAAGAWDTPYQTWAAAMFAAAQAAELNADGTKFKLFMSAEVGGLLTTANVQAMVNTFKGTAPATPTGISNTNYFWYAGKPLLTTSSGELGSPASDSAAGQAFWASVFSGGFTASFYPNFQTRRPVGGQVDTNCPTYAQVSADWNTWWKNVAEGLCYFQFDGLAINSDGSKGDLTVSAEAYAQLMGENSRLFMSGINSYYTQNNYVLTFMVAVERYGYEGLASQWSSIINTHKPVWVLLCTWNDLGEAYMTPADPANMPLNTAPDVNAWPHQYSHVGYAKFNAIFIEQYKTGASPAITKDELFYNYRTQPAALAPPATSITASIAGTTLTVTAIASGTLYLGQVLTGSGVTAGTTIAEQLTGTPGGVGTYRLWQSQTVSSRTITGIAVTTAFFNLEDKIYVTTRLTAPATLRVITGGSTVDTAVPSGMTHTRIPFNTGTQIIRLIRGSTLIDLTGDPISSSILYYNHNPTTGYGTYP